MTLKFDKLGLSKRLIICVSVFIVLILCLIIKTKAYEGISILPVYCVKNIDNTVYDFVEDKCKVKLPEGTKIQNIISEPWLETSLYVKMEISTDRVELLKKV